MPEISIEHITKHYRGHTALQNVSFHIPSGSIYGLLGPNGAGKTSLMRILNRMVLPDDGAVTFNQKPLSREHTRQIGYLPEERGLYKRMKVGEQIRYFARLKGVSNADATKRSNEWLEKFGLGKWKKRRVEELSKGMAQKVQFIVTVIHDPELLIMDEPFSGFDPVNARMIRTELLRMKEEGRTILLSTHNMASVEDICQHLTLINKGKVILRGKLEDIREAHATDVYEVEFKGNIIAFTNALWAGFELIGQKPVGREHHVAQIRMLMHNDVNAMLRNTLDHVKIQTIRKVIPSMEDIFINALSNAQNQPGVNA